ncbi:DEAD DEAH box helicase Type III restriction enzyme res subunit Helicase conserved C terminal domain [Trypanosoma vivax]|uniref:Putative ATP-dependent DEAD/H RNA helicase n=1 Tax=Trypanosoma vivax (strain Y486) TaxID=1055687 RepID=G0UBQ5_TRYVY|nr:putative ATP-dependent DEAD/H RNA helicase [Trypanosoma vivax]KAH8609571.1 DEAD DEAH box helicase Type III restriction enzyme res subunit Helicase conserved C terminal domain [Trypanosoma vivax]CCC53253.1 putative ATP-dependent DEAD/H RNA helicase [Trypanosoma vivax Y486]
MKCTGIARLKYLRASKATYGASAASLLDGYLQNSGDIHAANLPASQKYFYAQSNSNETDISQKHQMIRLRLGSAQMLQKTTANITNHNEAHPLFFSQTAPRAAGLCVSLVMALKKIGISRLTELQGALIPLLLKGKHVIAHAETGTGKSFGIALACANRIIRENINYRLHTIIIVPTEELALQYEKWLRHFCGSTQQMVQTAIEGLPLETQLARLHNVQPHILVGTPQRIADIVRLSPTLLGEKLRRKVDCVILDEADVLLFSNVRYGRQVIDGANLVDRVFRSQREEVPAQLVAASATIDGRTARALNTWMRNDKAVRLTTSFVEHTIPETISFYFFAACRNYTLARSLELVLRLICKQEKSPRVLLFTSSEPLEEVVGLLNGMGERCPEVREWLQGKPNREVSSLLESTLDCNTLRRPRICHGKRDVYVKDNNAIEKLNVGTLLVGVGNHNISRGIHVSGVTHVILFGDCPPAALFVHCAGRTGRMNAEGHVVVLYPPHSGRAVQQVCHAVEVPFLPGRMEQVEELLLISEFSSSAMGSTMDEINALTDVNGVGGGEVWTER